MFRLEPGQFFYVKHRGISHEYLVVWLDIASNVEQFNIVYTIRILLMLNVACIVSYDSKKHQNQEIGPKFD